MTEPSIDKEPRCWNCTGQLAAYLTRPWRVKCRKCHRWNSSEDHCRQEDWEVAEGK